MINYFHKLSQSGTFDGGLNPLKNDYNTIPNFINAILKIVMAVGYPLLVLAIVYVGFLFVWARGSEDKLTKAKEAFFWVVIGGLIILGATVISATIQSTVTQLGA